MSNDRYIKFNNIEELEYLLFILLKTNKNPDKKAIIKCLKSYFSYKESEFCYKENSALVLGYDYCKVKRYKTIELKDYLKELKIKGVIKNVNIRRNICS